MAVDVIAAARPRQLRAPDAATTVGLLSALLLIATTWLVLAGGPVVAWDWRFHLWADANLPGGWTRWLLDAFASVAGERLFTLPVLFLSAIWVAVRSGSRRPVLAVLAGVAAVAVVGYSIKFGLGRTPPWTGLDVLHGGGRAFPSGHAANAAYTWAMVAYLLLGPRGLRPHRVGLRVALAGAAVVAGSTGILMAALDYHWLSDVPGGWWVGVLALTVSLRVLAAPAPAPAPDLVPAPAPAPEPAPSPVGPAPARDLVFPTRS